MSATNLSMKYILIPFDIQKKSYKRNGKTKRHGPSIKKVILSQELEQMKREEVKRQNQ